MNATITYSIEIFLKPECMQVFKKLVRSRIRKLVCIWNGICTPSVASGVRSLTVDFCSEAHNFRYCIVMNVEEWKSV